jgi:hypothetical protein
MVSRSPSQRMLPCLCGCAPQIKRACECEVNTGPAQKPDLAAAAEAATQAGGGGEDAEVDPLDAFMAEIGQIESSAPPAKPRHERIEEQDTAADFMEVCRGWAGRCCWLYAVGYMCWLCAWRQVGR